MLTLKKFETSNYLQVQHILTEAVWATDDPEDGSTGTDAPVDVSTSLLKPLRVMYNNSTKMQGIERAIVRK